MWPRYFSSLLGHLYRGVPELIMRKILHFHLPKTGGSAIRHHLIQQMGVSSVSSSIVGMRLSDALLQWEGLDAISGHFTLHQADQLPTDRCALTVLRDPIDRFLSEYFYAKSDNAGRLLDARKHAMDLDAYLESLSPQERSDFQLQIEMLYPLGTLSQTTLSAEEKLVASAHALEKFELIGVQEELEDYAAMLDMHFAWPAKALVQKNVTSLRFNADALKSYQRKNLHSLLESEFELYELARNRFRRDRRMCITRSTAPPAGTADESGTSTPGLADDVTINAPRDFGDRRCVVSEVSVSGEISGRGFVSAGEQLTISIVLLANESIDALNIGIAIKDERGLLIFGTNSMLLGHVYTLEPGVFTVQFRMLNRMARGRYGVDVALVRSLIHYEGCYHWLEQACFFEAQDAAVSHFEGLLLMDAEVAMTSSLHRAAWTRLPYTQSKRQIHSLGRINKPLEQFAATITPMCQLDQLDSGTDVLLPMRVENLGAEIWPTFGQQPVVLSYRWLTAEGVVMVADGLRTRLPSDVSPGGAVLVPLRVRVPYEKGGHQLLISLVQEGVTWFAESNPNSTRLMKLSIA
jgi:hypothetical protein